MFPGLTLIKRKFISIVEYLATRDKVTDYFVIKDPSARVIIVLNPPVAYREFMHSTDLSSSFWK